MPVSIRSLFESAGVEPGGVVRFGQPVPETRPGVYIVALTSSLDELETESSAPINISSLDWLLDLHPSITVDNVAADSDTLLRRISSFWNPSETVLYIGRAGTSVRNRVRQYYTTPIGAHKPHAGGWWIKTLRDIENLFVHYAASATNDDAERRMLKHFAQQVPSLDESLRSNTSGALPFANLRAWDGSVKEHSIQGATGDVSNASLRPNQRFSRSSSTSGSVPAIPQSVRPVPSTHPGLSLARTQRVTAADLRAGQIRLPRASKSLFPQERVRQLEVIIRGRAMSARWDPRRGPDRERSGLLAFGKRSLDGVIEDNEIFRVETTDGLTYLT